MTKRSFNSEERKKTREASKLLGFQFPIDLDYDPDKSMVQKWREYFMAKQQNEKPVNETTAKCSQTMMRALMLFQAPTQIFIFMVYIVPYVFEDYGPWTIYYMKVLCWFVLINGLANWICVILYSPAYHKTKDNPFLNVERQWDNPPDQFEPQIERQMSQGNGYCVYDMTAKEALPWNFCKKCDMHVPPRAHHCNFCKACILKRDHHCFMVGNCIGFKNQRYFIILAFYAMVTGIIGGYFTYKYIHEVYWPTADSWTDLLFPVAIYRVFFGSTTVVHALLVFHVVAEFVFGVIGFAYFTSQLTIIADGKTLFEVAKKVPIKSNNSINRNIKSVFGDYWALNFFFPMTLIFPQRDDGIHWEGVKIDHNANEKWKDDGSIL